MLVRLEEGGPKFFPKPALEALGFTPTCEFNLGFEIKDFKPVPGIDPNAYELERKGKQSTVAYFTTVVKLGI